MELAVQVVVVACLIWLGKHSSIHFESSKMLTSSLYSLMQDPNMAEMAKNFMGGAGRGAGRGAGGA